jgi:hypothetical protein
MWNTHPSVGKRGAVAGDRVKGIRRVKNPKLLLLAVLLCVASFSASAQLNDTYVIAASANQQGAFGTHWKTRFSIFNPHLDYPLVVSVTFLPTGGATGIEELIELPANSLAYSDNLLDDLFEISSGGGSLLVATFPEDNRGVPDDIVSRSFLVTSDTYNDTPAGTFGQTIPGVWAGLLDYDSDGISSVAHNIRNQGIWRTNIGAVNLGRCSVTVRVNAYDADGHTVLEQAPLSVPPLGHIQDRLPVSLERGSLEFFVEDPCATDDARFAVVFPYTSTIDQGTGDPTYQTPTLLAEPNILFAKGQKIDPRTIGTKIDASHARRVRAQAERRGRATLKRSTEGWQITK